MLISEAIKKVLVQRTHADLAQLYNFGMECQLNVGRCGGTKIKKSSEDGTFKWEEWVNDDQTESWKSIRIPRNASSDPVYKDREVSYDVDKYVESIGLTGWNWIERKSYFFGFDFDSIAGHKKGLSAEELQEVRDTAMAVDWIEVRRSTSGNGFHFYIHLDEPFDTSNHTEHAAIARAILGKLTAETGYAFDAKVDVCGHNMWFWHKKMEGTNGLELVKKGVPFKTKHIPINWRDHMDVVTGTKKRVRAGGQGVHDLISQRTLTGLDAEHLRLIKHLEGSSGYFDADNYMLVTHTFSLREAHKDLCMRGMFDTGSTGTSEVNCFAFPIPNGGWKVVRYGRGTKEHELWNQDGKGWTTCYLNVNPDLPTLSRSFGAIEGERNWFVYPETSVAKEALMHIGIDLNVPMNERVTRVKLTEDGRVIVKIDRDAHKDSGQKMSDWEVSKDKTWTKIFNAPKLGQREDSVENFDNFVRHIVSSDNRDLGFTVYNRQMAWVSEPLMNVKLFLKGLGKKVEQIEKLIGHAVNHPWRVVNLPFQEEYPGGRDWNRDAPQYTYKLLGPEHELKFPSWELLFNHLGRSLDSAVMQDPWCIEKGITSGAQYLILNVASIFKEPDQPTPYLFFFGEQGTGKSMYHEALSLLMTKGYVRADEAMKNKSGFNGELLNAVLCVVEETNLGKNHEAYARLKDWVTSLMIPINMKGMTPINVRNTTHWCQFSNEQSACPVFTGDRRITYIFVDRLEHEIPKKKFLKQLQEEAQHFLTYIVQRVEIPETNERLNIPPVHTEYMQDVQMSNESALEKFIRGFCFYTPGHLLKVNEFFVAFKKWLGDEDPIEAADWNMIKVSKEMPIAFPKILGQRYVKGRDNKANWCYGNLSLEEKAPDGVIINTGGQMLKKIDQMAVSAREHSND